MRDGSVVYTFDTETTGTDPARDQIIELCIQRGFGETAESRTWRFLPDVPIAPDAERVHGISMADLQGEPRFVERVDEVRGMLEQAKVLVGYNLRFDLDMVQSELRRCGAAPLDLHGILLLDPFRLWQRCEPRSLQDAHRRFVGSSFDGAHGAAADVAATARVLEGMIEDFALQELDWEGVATRAEPERLRFVGSTNHLQWDADGDICLGFGKHGGKKLAEFVRSYEGRGYVEWMLGKDFPPHVVEVLASLKQSQSIERWRDEVIARFGPPPGPEAFSDDAG
ncbi:MAG: hypothetical protein RIT45_2445 [Pseudomonadota bacterium]|jgi:DNA polymerase-3 subunit epsilon